MVKRQLSVGSETGKAAHNDKINKVDVKYLPEDTNVVYSADVGEPDSIGYVFAFILFNAGAVMIVLRLRKPKP